MAFDPLLVYHLAADLLTCAEQRVALTDAGLPPRRGVVPGDVALDDCCPGMMAVTAGDAVPSTTFPIPDFTLPPCGVTQQAIDFTIWIVRCAPGPQPNGSPPTVEQLDKAARVQMADARAVWSGVDCCLGAFRRSGFDAMLRRQLHYGPEGACMGSQTTVVVGLLDGCACDPVVLRAQAPIP